MITALITCAISLSAQTSQVATLSHDGQITTYYSANALKDAYAAAVDGDIITLSSGQFYGCDMDNKSQITLRGAGMMPDANPTIITNDIRMGNTGINDWTIEGILFTGDVRHNGINGKFVKCYFAKTLYLSNTINVTILHCILKNVHAYRDGEPSRTFINSYLYQSNDLYNSTLTNCVVLSYTTSWIYDSVLKNCIICGREGDNTPSLPQSTTASYTYYVGASEGDVFRNSPSTTNVMMKDLGQDDIFKDLITFELKDEFAETWLGEDGTQIGMHGGFIPFDPTPTNPQITKFNVASKTTADGKLSVDIEVKAN